MGIVSRVLLRLEEWLLATSVLAIAALSSINIVCRSFLGFSLAATEELTQFCMFLLCFVGLSYAAARGRHIRMTAVYDLASAEVQRWWMAGIASVTTGLLAILTWYAAQYVLTVYQLGGIYPATRAPFWCVYAIVPLGLGLTTLQYAATVWRNLRGHRPYLSALVPDHRWDEESNPSQSECLAATASKPPANPSGDGVANTGDEAC